MSLIPKIVIPKVSDHGSEILLLSWLGSGVLIILGIAAVKDKLGGSDAIDVAAFLLVLQRIVEAVQKRWEQRSIDRMGQSLANAPPSDPPAGSPDGGKS
jgi:hypothetical protein